jgi:hypothetical protein
LQKMIPMICQLFGREARGNPEFGFAIGKLHASLHDANHSAFFEVQSDFFSDDFRITSKTPQPEAVAQDGNVIRARKIIVRPKVAAKSGGHTKNGKQIGSDSFSDEVFRVAIPGEIQGNAGDRGDVFEDFVSRFPIGEIRDDRSRGTEAAGQEHCRPR